MQTTTKPKYLDKSALFELLSQRFHNKEKKLSQIPDPSLLHDAPKAAAKIAEHIQSKKKITVVGDYDVDGVSSSAIVADFFAQIPYPIDVVIPNRFRDGYGVSPPVLQRIESDLIITVDNGINALEAATLCKERGIELIITDHHTPSEILPEAYAIVDPKLKECNYPFKEICGAQVIWLVLGLVKKELQLNIDMKSFLDILAIAIIADVMPLVDINRALVKEGLKLLHKSSRPSSIIIRDFLNKSKISSEDIAFNIAPRINSAGRLEDASIALKFFTAPTLDLAYSSFEELTQLNQRRKEIEAECTQQAVEEILNQVQDDGSGVHNGNSGIQDDGNGMQDDNTFRHCGPDPQSNSKLLNLVNVVAGEGWNEGVVGIVASRLVDKFGKPAIVLSIKDGIAKGSARSVGDVDIYSLIKENQHYLQKFGGHKMAAGLSLDLENLQKFKEGINYTASLLDPESFFTQEQTLGALKSKEIDFELLHIIESFEPYGEANPRPLFFMDNADISEIKTFGNDKSHSKIILKPKEKTAKKMELILFRKVLEMPANRAITCSYTINKNEYNNNFYLQLLIKKIYS